MQCGTHPTDRAFIREDLVDVAKGSPDVEFVVRRLKQGKAALLRGHYGKRRDGTRAVLISDRLRLLFYNTTISQRQGQGRLCEQSGSTTSSQQGQWND